VLDMIELLFCKTKLNSLSESSSVLIIESLSEIMDDLNLEELLSGIVTDLGLIKLVSEVIGDLGLVELSKRIADLGLVEEILLSEFLISSGITSIDNLLRIIYLKEKKMDNTKKKNKIK